MNRLDRTAPQHEGEAGKDLPQELGPRTQPRAVVPQADGAISPPDSNSEITKRSSPASHSQCSPQWTTERVMTSAEVDGHTPQQGHWLSLRLPAPVGPVKHAGRRATTRATAVKQKLVANASAMAANVIESRINVMALARDFAGIAPRSESRSGNSHGTTGTAWPQMRRRSISTPPSWSSRFT